MNRFAVSTNVFLVSSRLKVSPSILASRASMEKRVVVLVSPAHRRSDLSPPSAPAKANPRQPPEIAVVFSHPRAALIIFAL